MLPLQQLSLGSLLFIVLLLLCILSNDAQSGELPYNEVAYKKTLSVKADPSLVIKITKDLDKLSYEQLKVLATIHDACKPYDMEDICMAISYKESKLGKYLFNTITGDFGNMGINLKTFINKKKLKLNYWGKKELASKLITNDDLNIAVAIDNLKYWRKITNDNWKIVIGSYNGGWTPNSGYVVSILSIKKALKLYFRKHKDIREALKGKNYV